MKKIKDDQSFLIEKDFSVKKDSTFKFIVEYFPLNIVENNEMKFNIVNSQTNQIFEYILIGNVEEPLAREHFLINCQAKNTFKKNIQISNFLIEKNTTYDVECDLEFFKGNNTISVHHHEKVNYKFEINPNIGGLYAGYFIIIISYN